MKEKDLKHILQQDYSFIENWKPILNLLFGKIDYFSTPSNPFSGEDSVISGKQIGAIKLDDNKSLAIFEVEVDDSIRIDQNRKGLRDIAAKHIDQNITHGALVFFYSKNQIDYRFSFIAKWSEIDLETGEFIKGETKPKRYTYLLGRNESCTTAAKRLLVLAEKKQNGENINLQTVMDTFSVEPLKKDFFKSYKEHYNRFWQYIANEGNGYRNILLDTSKEKEDEQEKPIRDFVKKLLGRIVFLHFLQKKGWMGCPANSKKWEDGEKQFMQLLFDNFENKEHFHSQCLTKLFFNTLNSRRNNDIFEIKGLHGKLNGSRVPYLNGGLFEADKPEEILSVDFPVKFFEELFEFFAQYNFTIDENSPDDHEVGIDPEMLGHIFENLLEENREKGAFYTPKEVVEYMCKESTIQYLNNHFPEEAQVEDFVRNHQVSEYFTDRDNAIALSEKLDAIKVCDPAIGSGAFPIGILHELFEAKKFIYPYLKTNKEFNPAKIKKDIIQNSIYGVDIEKGAVDIAQLRFWLALVVDETEPQPLPNLDYKIMQGNSLLESFEGIDLSKVAHNDIKIVEPERDLFGNIKESQMKMTFTKSGLVEEIQNFIKEYFNIENHKRKNEIKQQIDKLVNQHILFNLELRETQLKRWIAEAGNPNALKNTARKKYDLWLTELSDFERKKETLLEIQKTDERPYFLWHLYFMDVFEQGGFDIMIGNPPYIQLQKMGKETDILQAEKFETFKRTGDIYTLFYEKGINLLKEKEGVLTYITSNTWMRTKFGEALRNFFITKSNPIKLLNFEDTKIFPSATVEVNIMLTKKEPWNNNLQAVAIKGDYLPSMSITKYFDNHRIELSKLNNDEWFIGDREEILIKNTIENNTKLLKELEINIFRGVTTGFNEAFFINEDTKNRLIEKDKKSDEIIKPLLRGRELNKYYTNITDNYIIFTKRGINIDNYPAIKEYLLQFYDKLKPKKNKSEKKGRKPGDYKWFEIQDNTAYYSEFSKEKLFWIQLSDINRFSYSKNEVFATNSCFLLTLKDDCNISIKYLSAILNSKLIQYYFNMIGSTSGMGTLEWTKVSTEKIPIKISNKDIRIKIECIIGYMNEIVRYKNTNKLFSLPDYHSVYNTYNSLINMMVYELYFEEHMKEQNIDVLRFVNFQDISQLETFEEKRDVIQREYYKLKEKDNPIRNRILLAPVHSPNIIKRINESTH
jgi:hypothetical protein